MWWSVWILLIGVSVVAGQTQVNVAYATQYNSAESQLVRVTNDDLIARIGYWWAIEDSQSDPDISPYVTMHDTGWFDTACSTTIAARNLIHHVNDHPDLHAVIGPECSDGAAGVAQLSPVLGIPQITGGASDNALSDHELYPNFYRTGSSQSDLVSLWVHFMNHYGWTSCICLSDSESWGAVESLITSGPANNVTVEAASQFILTDDGSMESAVDSLMGTHSSVLIITFDHTAPFFRRIDKLLSILRDRNMLVKGRVILADDRWLYYPFYWGLTGQPLADALTLLQGLVDFSGELPSSTEFFDRMVAHINAKVDEGDPEYTRFANSVSFRGFYRSSIFLAYDATYAVARAAVELVKGGQAVTSQTINDILPSISFTGVRGNVVNLNNTVTSSAPLSIINGEGTEVFHRGRVSAANGVELFEELETCLSYMAYFSGCKIRFVGDPVYDITVGNTTTNPRATNITFQQIEVEESVIPTNYLCREGYQATSTGGCLKCQSGWYSNATMSHCESCPMGTYLPDGENVCTLCPKGTYNDVEGQEECTPCGIRSYNAEEGATSCESCPTGSSTCFIVNADEESCPTMAESVSECVCEEGFFGGSLLHGGDTQKTCVRCPEGATCCMCQQIFPCVMNLTSSEDELTNCSATIIENLSTYGSACADHCVTGTPWPITLPGYYNVHDALDIGTDDTEVLPLIVPCEQQSQCLGGLDNKCAEGSFGSRCGRCDDGYYIFRGRCEACPTAYPILTILVFGIITTVILFSLKAAVQWFRSGSLAILLDFFQTLSIFGAMAIPWSGFMMELLDVVSLTQLDMDLLAPECSFNWDFWTKLILHLLFPIMLLPVMMIMHAVAIYRYRNLVDENREKMVRRSRMAITNAYLMILSVAHAMLTKRAFAPLRCVSYGSDRYWMMEEPSIECYSSEWLSYLPVVIIAIVAYGFGIPLFIWSILHRNRNNLNQRDTKRRYGSIYIIYNRRSTAVYFEVWVKVKKLWLLVGMAIFTEERAGAISLWVTPCLVIDVVLSTHSVYIFDHNNTLRTICVVCTAICFGGGLTVLIMDLQTVDGTAAVSTLLGVLLLFVILYSAHAVISEALTYYGKSIKLLQTQGKVFRFCKAAGFLRDIRHWATEEEIRDGLRKLPNAKSVASAISELIGESKPVPGEGPLAVRKRRSENRPVTVVEMDEYVDSRPDGSSVASEIRPLVQHYLHQLRSWPRKQFIDMMTTMVSTWHVDDVGRLVARERAGDPEWEELESDVLENGYDSSDLKKEKGKASGSGGILQDNVDGGNGSHVEFPVETNQTAAVVGG